MEQINDILAKYFSGEASPEEANLVAEWKRANEEEYKLLSEAWRDTDLDLLKGMEFKAFDHKAAWQKVDEKLADEKEVKIIKLNFYKKVAAACAVLLVGLTGFWFLNRGNGFDTVSNTAGTPKEISLPDGSTVWLASNSTLEYNADFKNERSLNLKGEAFFEVAPDKSHPFIITTAHGNVEVLGTGFNVDAANNSTVVSVDHGKVALENESGRVELTAGQSASANENNVSEINETTANFDAWKTGMFEFNDTAVEEVILQLNKHYEKEVILSDTQKSKEIISGSFDNRPIEEIIEVIVLTCDVTAEYEADVIRLR